MPQPEVEDESATCVYCGFSGAEPEQDGAVSYFSCPDCGGDFGYQQRVPDGPVCPAGIPVVMLGSQAGESSVNIEEHAPVFLGPTIPRRPQ